MLPPFAVTPLYAALCGLLLLGLGLVVVRLRRQHKVLTGDGGNATLARAMRVQANFVEYVPLTLLLLFMLEMSRQPAWALHLLGAALFLGRLLRNAGVSADAAAVLWPRARYRADLDRAGRDVGLAAARGAAALFGHAGLGLLLQIRLQRRVHGLDQVVAAHGFLQHIIGAEALGHAEQFGRFDPAAA